MVPRLLLFIGSAKPLAPSFRPSGIVKTRIDQPLWLGMDGLVGDEQADRRAHGGTYMALHQYPQSHYARLAQVYPQVAAQLVAGSIGENLSVAGWDESQVCIGDSFRLGQALIQISQPRAPCYKIDDRFGVAGMAQFIDRQGITGWYYRVLEAGEVVAGCAFDLVQRPHQEHTLARLWALWQAHRPATTELAEFAGLPELSPKWREKLHQRVRWLQSNVA